MIDLTASVRESAALPRCIISEVMQLLAIIQLVAGLGALSGTGPIGLVGIIGAILTSGFGFVLKYLSDIRAIALAHLALRGQSNA